LATTVSPTFSLVLTEGTFCVSAMAKVFFTWCRDVAVCGVK
jgi:hypothetical protein